MSGIGISVIGKRIIAKDIPKEEKGSLLIVPEMRKLEKIVEVVEAPEDAKVKIGDKIMISASYMHKIEHEGKEYFLVPYDDIIGIIR